VTADARMRLAAKAYYKARLAAHGLVTTAAQELNATQVARLAALQRAEEELKEAAMGIGDAEAMAEKALGGKKR
jgi:hypothetical protein